MDNFLIYENYNQSMVLLIDIALICENIMDKIMQ